MFTKNADFAPLVITEIAPTPSAPAREAAYKAPFSGETEAFHPAPAYAASPRINALVDLWVKYARFTKEEAFAQLEINVPLKQNPGEEGLQKVAAFIQQRLDHAAASLKAAESDKVKWARKKCYAAYGRYLEAGGGEEMMRPMLGAFGRHLEGILQMAGEAEAMLAELHVFCAEILETKTTVLVQNRVRE